MNAPQSQINSSEELSSPRRNLLDANQDNPIEKPAAAIATAGSLNNLLFKYD